MATFRWNSSATTPYRTTTYYNGATTLSNTVSNVPLGRAGYRLANGISDTNAAIYITTARMYLAGYGSSSTVSINVGTASSSSFSVAGVSTSLVEPRAANTGFKTVNMKVGAGTTSLSMGVTCNSAIFFGRWGNTADSTTLWGECEYIEVPTAPGTPSASNETSSGFRASWSAASDFGGGSLSNYVVQISTSSSFSSGTIYETTNTYYDFSGLSASTTYYVRVFAGNEIYTDFSSQSVSVASGTLTAATTSAYNTPVITNGLSNQTLRVGEYFSDYVSANYTYSAYGQGGTNFSISSNLPAGNNISVTDSGTYGSVGGTVGSIATGNYTVTLTASGPGGSVTDSATYSISQALPSWTDTSLPNGTKGTYYSSTFSATNATSWNITGIPAGMASTGTNGSTVTIYGTPTVYGSQTITATPYNTDNAAGSTQNISFYLNDSAVAWADNSLSAFDRKGTSYSDGVSAIGGTTRSYSISSGSLPSGISLSSSTGTISGTLTGYGPYSFTVRASNADGTSLITANFSGTILDVALTWSDQILTSSIATQDVSYTDGVSVQSGPTVSYSVYSGSLPTGISLNSSTGVISGTPTVPDEYPFVIRATNGSNETIETSTLTITVESAGGYVKVWNGTTWADGTAYVRQSGTWVEGTVKLRGASSWGDSFSS